MMQIELGKFEFFFYSHLNPALQTNFNNVTLSLGMQYRVIFYEANINSINSIRTSIFHEEC